MGLKNLAIMCALILFGGFKHANCQFMRDIVIFPDSVAEFNKTGASDVYIERGVRIALLDTTGKGRLQMISYYKNDVVDGDVFVFDRATNMLIVKESYKSGKLDGTVYYWNKKGFLIRTEVWKNNKLIRKRIYKAIQ